MRGAEFRATVSFFHEVTSFRHFVISVKNPVELDGNDNWQEFSSYRNSMDFNNGECHWRIVRETWDVTGSDYQIPA